MLILTRRIGERLMIGDDIVVKIIKIDGRQVVVGIDAPRDVRIQREEIIGRDDDSQLVLGQCPDCYAINGHEPNCTRRSR